MKNLVDYVFGIETGLDTNARKNRSGHIMEKTVANIFLKACIPFRQEVYSKEWAEINRVLGDDEKRFDFVVETLEKIYLIEVNFYSGGGSKLNEVARSYSDIAPKINSVKGFEFVWITDGIGWKSAKNKLQEAYNIIPKIYNLTSIEEDVYKRQVQHLRVFVPNDINVFLFKISNPLRNAVQNYPFYAACKLIFA